MANPAMGTCELAQALQAMHQRPKRHTRLLLGILVCALMAAFWLLAPRVLANLR